MITFETTYLELAKNKYPDMSEDEILSSCPHTLGVMTCACSTFADYCYDCWNGGVNEYDLKESKVKEPEILHVSITQKFKNLINFIKR